MGREKLLPRLADLPALGPPRLTGSTCESIWEIYPHFVSPTPQNAERGPCGRPPRSQRLNELCRPSPHRADSRTVPSSKLHTTVAPFLMFGISLELGCFKDGMGSNRKCRAAPCYGVYLGVARDFSFCALQGRLLKLQIPSTKHQRNLKLQNSHYCCTAFDVRNFSGGWMLELGCFISRTGWDQTDNAAPLPTGDSHFNLCPSVSICG